MVPEVKKGQDVFSWIDENLNDLLSVADPCGVYILAAVPSSMFDFKISGKSWKVKPGVSAEMMRSAFIALEKKDVAAFREVLTDAPSVLPEGAIL